MPDWLVEGEPVIYLVLALAGVVCALLWWRTRRRAWLVGIGVVIVAFAGYVVLDRLYESPREQMTRKVSEIATAVSRSDFDAAFNHVSDRFQRAGVNKEGFRRFANERRRSGFVNDVQVWDIHPVEVEGPRAVVECRFKVHGSFGETPPDSMARIIFHRDDDGQWRVQDFDWFSSIAESNSPRPIPGWGG